jgi:FkbM family methyltransferase
MTILNPFVSKEILNHEMPDPTIPAVLQPTFAQAYEDVIIDGLIYALLTKGKRLHLVFFEIGANHPVATSASFLLKKKYNVHTILVEANPDLIPALKKHRPDDTVIHAAVTNQPVKTVSFARCPDNEISSINEIFVKAWKDGTILDKIDVPAISINQLIQRFYIYEAADIILSIDIEGHDYEVLTDLDFERFRPLIIIVEPSEEFAPGTVEKMMTFMQSKGYSLYSRTFVNLIFTRSE